MFPPSPLLLSLTQQEDNPAEWLIFSAPSNEWSKFTILEPEIQSYQVLLMCFQFLPESSTCNLQKKSASILQRAALPTTILPVSVQDSFHMWLLPNISSNWCISPTVAPKHRLGLQKRSYGLNLSVSGWQEDNQRWQLPVWVAFSLLQLILPAAVADVDIFSCSHEYIASRSPFLFIAGWPPAIHLGLGGLMISFLSRRYPGGVVSSNLCSKLGTEALTSNSWESLSL